MRTCPRASPDYMGLVTTRVSSIGLVSNRPRKTEAIESPIRGQDFAGLRRRTVAGTRTAEQALDVSTPSSRADPVGRRAVCPRVRTCPRGSIPGGPDDLRTEGGGKSRTAPARPRLSAGCRRRRSDGRRGARARRPLDGEARRSSLIRPPISSRSARSAPLYRASGRLAG
jgi:hypothetical protein